MFFNRKTEFFDALGLHIWHWSTVFIAEKLCFSNEKQSLSVDKQCLSNWEALFFDKLCFSIHKTQFIGR